MSDNHFIQTTERRSLPLLPLKDVVVFPHAITPLFVGRPASISALLASEQYEERLFLVTQRDPEIDAPTVSDLYTVGVVASVLHTLKLQDGTMKILIEGLYRARLIDLVAQDPHQMAVYEPIESHVSVELDDIQAHIRVVLKKFEHIAKSRKKIPHELPDLLSDIKNPELVIDIISAHLLIDLEKKQKILENTDIHSRFHDLETFLEQETDMIHMEEQIQHHIKEQMEENQHRYYLNEKMKALTTKIKETQAKLDDLSGSNSSVHDNEHQKLLEQIEKAGMPEAVKLKALSEFEKFKMMPQMSAEATVSRNYLDCLVQVPWYKCSHINRDLKRAEQILNRDHYGLEDVKSRILEYLAVQIRVRKSKGSILCLVGPPGVGKTSLGASTAAVLGRKFERFALGGISDQAEIRGHRRTYVGAFPGKIMQALIKSGVKNPLIMCDEVDKMGMDARGDPAAALLEVLDPVQNAHFHDHYLEVDYDLSDVVFLLTANNASRIPLPLLDRLEVVYLSGYTEEEKLAIAKNYLLPRQKKQCGLKKHELNISETAILSLIRTYTHESGVRELERNLARICRKVLREILESNQNTSKKSGFEKCIDLNDLEHYLGVQKFRYGVADATSRIGHVTGLAWTEMGGDLLTIEAQVVPGTGKVQQTGNLGTVMKESMDAAMTVLRSRAATWKVSERFFQEHDFHIHVPEGATPKDGPSAGIGIATVLISLVAHLPVRSSVAMTGEITLSGDILPIGGLKEKLLAARRGGIETVIIPEENQKQLTNMPLEVTQSLRICPVKHIEEVLCIALDSRESIQ